MRASLTCCWRASHLFRLPVCAGAAPLSPPSHMLSADHPGRAESQGGAHGHSPGRARDAALGALQAAQAARPRGPHREDLGLVGAPPARVAAPWRRISAQSVLKTTRDPAVARRATMAEGQTLFSAQAAQLRRDEMRQKVLSQLWLYRRPAGSVAAGRPRGWWLSRGGSGGLAAWAGAYLYLRRSSEGWPSSGHDASSSVGVCRRPGFCSCTIPCTHNLRIRNGPDWAPVIQMIRACPKAVCRHVKS